jgi:hypothetical protein
MNENFLKLFFELKGVKNDILRDNSVDINDVYFICLYYKSKICQENYKKCLRKLQKIYDLNIEKVNDILNKYKIKDSINTYLSNISGAGETINNIDNDSDYMFNYRINLLKNCDDRDKLLKIWSNISYISDEKLYLNFDFILMIYKLCYEKIYNYEKIVLHRNDILSILNSDLSLNNKLINVEKLIYDLLKNQE